MFSRSSVVAIGLIVLTLAVCHASLRSRGAASVTAVNPRHSGGLPPATPTLPELRVCADPNNLPFSNDKQEGFENAIAQLVASDLHRRVTYTWLPQRRGFARNTLNARKCDVIMGVPSSYELAMPTRPYYRSTYVFVTRPDRRVAIHSFDDPELRRVRIGVHFLGTPTEALAKRHIIQNVRSYSVYGDYSKPNPPADLIAAVARGDVDVAIAWGPLAGYFARRESIPLRIVAVSPQIDLPFLPFVFDISMAVRRGDNELRDALDGVIERRGPDIRAILRNFGVPLVGGADAAQEAPTS